MLFSYVVYNLLLMGFISFYLYKCLKNCEFTLKQIFDDYIYLCMLIDLKPPMLVSLNEVHFFKIKIHVWTRLIHSIPISRKYALKLHHTSYQWINALYMYSCMYSKFYNFFHNNINILQHFIFFPQKPFFRILSWHLTQDILAAKEGIPRPV